MFTRSDHARRGNRTRLLAVGAIAAVVGALLPLTGLAMPSSDFPPADSDRRHEATPAMDEAFAGAFVAPEVHTDSAAFEAATAAEPVDWATDAATALADTPFGDNLVDYSCTTGPVTTPGGDATLANTGGDVVCYLGSEWAAGTSNVDPTPERPTLVKRGEDDFHIEPAIPAHAVGVRLLTNGAANETVTLTFADDTTAVFADTALDTEPNGFHFIGFVSERPITKISIDTEPFGEQNEGIDGIWLSPLRFSPTLECEEPAVFVGASGAAADTPVVTVGPLTSGVDYEVTASGVFFGGGGGVVADAEFSQAAEPSTEGTPWTDVTTGHEAEGESFLELWIDGAPVEWSDGAFQPNHIYEYTLTADGDTVSFQIADVVADDNTGGLCVTVEEAVEATDVDSASATVEWMAPVTHDRDHHGRSTLPLKFRLDGATDGDVYLQVHEGAFADGVGADDVVATFEPGLGSDALRTDGVFVANLRLRDLEPGTYAAVVHLTDGTVLGHVDFTVAARIGSGRRDASGPGSG